uniref:Ovule protein n=1 Tax=Strongyloides venezuelensis TaxID=75913 RepID=A0A0K0G5H3_STRVS
MASSRWVGCLEILVESDFFNIVNSDNVLFLAIQSTRMFSIVVERFIFITSKEEFSAFIAESIVCSNVWLVRNFRMRFFAVYMALSFSPLLMK